MSVTYTQTIGFRTLVLHRPGFDAPDTFAPFCQLSAGDVPDGTVEYSLPALIDGSPARFGDPDKPFTVSVYVVASSWHNASAARLVAPSTRRPSPSRSRPRTSSRRCASSASSPSR